MRIWDLPCSVLCRKHLLGEHRELHAIWTYITTDKGSSYRKHPETKRWYGKESALWRRHEQQVREMERRGYNHKSPLYPIIYKPQEQNEFVNTISEQIQILHAKGCQCNV